MNSSIIIINRNNYMIYRKGEETLIRTYEREVKIHLTEYEHRALMEIVKGIENVERYDVLEANVTLQGDVFRKNIKLMLQLGMIFIVTDERILTYIEHPVLDVYKQYAPKEINLLNELDRITGKLFYVSKDFRQLFPDYETLFAQFGLQTTTNEMEHDVFTITSLNEKLSMNRENGVAFMNYSDAFMAFHYASQNELDYVTQLFGLPVQDPMNEIRQQVAGIYLLTYIIKSFVNRSKQLMIITQEYKMYEKEINFFHKEDTLPISASPPPIVVNDNITQIQTYENVIDQSISFLHPASHAKYYPEIYQMGFSSYPSLYGHHGQMEELIGFGLEYEEIASKVIKKGIRNYLNQRMDGTWIVADSEQYYEEKLLALLHHVHEPCTEFLLDEDSIPKSLIGYWKSVTSLSDSDHTVIIIRCYEESKAIQLIIHDVTNDLCFSTERTIRLEEELESLIINYYGFLLNQDKPFKTLYDFDLRPPLEIQKREVRTFETIKSSLPNMNMFLEIGSEVLSDHKMIYDEESWIYERRFGEMGIIVRKLGVHSLETVQ